MEKNLKKPQLFGNKDSGPVEFASRFVDKIMMDEPTTDRRWFYCRKFVVDSLTRTLCWFWFFHPAFRRVPRCKPGYEDPLWKIGLAVAILWLWALHFLECMVALGKGVATELEAERMVALVREDVAMVESRNGYVSGQETLAWWVHEIYKAGWEEASGDNKDLEKGE
ncbi:hypothetical protein IFR05_000120 [Cadophora sp. M221]|nr:hypothetical protein IFR05_000120 [Cadophora sp. M221]